MTNGARLVLVTGATGYVGSRLLNQLESLHVPVRCLARRPEYLHERVASDTDVVGGDVLDAASLTAAFDGVDTAYYLVHSMGSAGSFEEEDRQARVTSPKQPVRQGSDESSIWEGWATRRRRSRPPTESPRGWCHSPSQRSAGHRVSRLNRTGARQPLFRDDSHLDGTPASNDHTSLGFGAGTTDCHPGPAGYLIAGLDHAIDGSRIYEIGGADQVSYGDLIREYARQRGLRRLIIRCQC